MGINRGYAARKAALNAIGEVLVHHHPLEPSLIEILSASDMEPRDAHFAQAMAVETIRRLGQLEDLIRRFVNKTPPRHKAGPTLEILYLSACELVFMDVAAHAAVDGANRLAAADPKARHFKPLINAVLHKVARDGKEIVSKQDPTLNVPDWLFHRWTTTYGEETARQICHAHLHPAPLDIISPWGVMEDAEHLFGDVYRMSPRRVDEMPGYAEGKWWVQDAAASLPAMLLGDVKAQRVLDLCAAPGGKTLELAAAGARVTAVDVEESRMARLQQNLLRTGLSAETLVADVSSLELEPAPFVLIDAPCSATGTIRRHPELPWIKGAADVVSCAETAAELLDAAANLTAPGGTLVFAVCSLAQEEGPEQVEDFLVSRHQDFERVPVTAEELFGHDEWITEHGDLRTLPCHMAEKGGMDGFFAARFKRNAS